ncbi:MAG TPA: DUF4232 domain-containing protein, partial [Solirubrobacterales bacterium]|nr:DUF4232 domain-containing protein [Solirubrobacterales bacterium]
MRTVASIAVLAALSSLGAVGCGGGGRTTTVVRTVTTPARAPVRRLSIAHRDRGAPRVEPGHRPRSEAGCVEPRGGRVKTVYLRSGGETCVRVAPRDRLLFVNAIDVGAGHREPEPVEVDAGPYEAYAPTDGSALFPVPVGTYLGLGSHRVETDADATTPWVLVLPEGCRVRDTKPGESLCFPGHRPPCKASDLRVHEGRGGAGAGTYYGHVLVINRSSHICTVSGFPRVTPLDAAGRPLAASFPTSGYTSLIGGGNHPRTIALEPGAAA